MPSDTSTDVVSPLWGVAEATLFFVVPDVWISHIAIRHGLRKGLASSVGALAGAMVGGVVMYCWGMRDGDGAMSIILRLPAIDRMMITEVDNEVQRRGAAALLLGPLRGRPYKLYAVAAGHRSEPLAQLLLWSVPGRLVRFALTAVGGAGARRMLRDRLDQRGRTMASWLAWTGIYAIMWTVGPGAATPHDDRARRQPHERRGNPQCWSDPAARNG
jgi:membrane protein YqaA with SNARE-associated domain